MKICKIEDCERKHHSLGWCILHYSRYRKHGDPNTVLKRGAKPGERNGRWTGDDATYAGIHQRLVRERGKAKHHQCARCENQAVEWSYTHVDANDRMGEHNGNQVPYSTNLDFYEPLCRSHHRLLDRAAKAYRTQSPNDEQGQGASEIERQSYVPGQGFIFYPSELLLQVTGE
jgi:hypothetical protein